LGLIGEKESKIMSEELCCKYCGNLVHLEQGLQPESLEDLWHYDCHVEYLEAENRLLKSALGHADAALDGWGGDKELVKALGKIRDYKQSFCGRGAATARWCTCEKMREIATETLKKHNGE
jgi:hypothetical protein